MSNTPILPPLPKPNPVPGFYEIAARLDNVYTAAQMEAYAKAAIALNAPAGLTMDDAFTVKGHAVFLRMEGQTDMPDYFDGLAERIKALAAPAPQRDAPAGGAVPRYPQPHNPARTCSGSLCMQSNRCEYVPCISRSPLSAQPAAESQTKEKHHVEAVPIGARVGFVSLPLRLTFDEWQAKHGPNGGAYDIEQQRAGWNGALWAVAAAAPEAQPAAEPVAKTYVQHVPDWCDRIVWQGRYIHLPIDATPQAQPSPEVKS